MATNKTYFARIYSPTVSGTTVSGLIGTYKDFTGTGTNGAPTFTWQINSGMGSMEVQFARPISSFDEGNSIALYNQFDLYIVDKESPSTGQLVYSGYINDYSTYFDDSNNEYIDVNIYPYSAEFAQKLLCVSGMMTTGGNTQVAYYNMDPSNILQDVFNRYDGKVVGSNNTVNITENFQDFTHDNTVVNTAYWFDGATLQSGWDNDTIVYSGAWNNYLFGYNLSGSSNWDYAGQTFTPANTSILQGVLVEMGTYGYPTDTVVCALYNTSGGVPTTILAWATNSASGSIITAQETFFFTFNDIVLTKGTQYAFVYSRTGGNSSSNFYLLFGRMGSSSGGSVVWHMTSPTQWYIDSATESFFDRSSIYYTPTVATAQSLGYDTGMTSSKYVLSSLSETIPASTSISMLWSDSSDNINWNAWTPNIGSLSNRFFRWQATLSGTQTVTPVLNSLTVNVQSGPIAQTGNSVSYIFNQNTIQECLDQCVAMAPAWWYWTVGPTNRLKFDQRNTNLVNHYFTVGQNIASITLNRSVANLHNIDFFTNNSTIYVSDVRTSSVASYGTRVNRIQDERIVDNTSANLVEQADLNLFDHPQVVATVVVVDSNGDNLGGYNIEAIQPGQVCVINPANNSSLTYWDVAVWDVDYWDYPLTTVYGVPMWIVSVQYELERATLQLAYLSADGAKMIQSIKKGLQQNRTSKTPATPTVLNN